MKPGQRLLKRIEKGEVTLNWVKGGFGGPVYYTTNEGHTIEVFNECGAWGFIDKITHNNKVWFCSKKNYEDEFVWGYDPEDAIKLKMWKWQEVCKA